MSSQFQTTPPQVIRERLQVSKKDKLRYRSVRGAIVIEKAVPLSERLGALHRSIREKVSLAQPGLTAREARERSLEPNSFSYLKSSIGWSAE